MDNHYLIGRIAGTDFMGLLNLDLKLEGRSIRLVGKNRAGKSSGLNLISAALEGLDRRRKTAWGEQPIRQAKTATDGSQGDPQPGKAMAELTLIGPDGEDVVVHREFTTSKDGEKVVSSVEIIPKSAIGDETPQRWLSRLVSPNALDPWAFVRADQKEQVAILCRSLGIEDQRRELMKTRADLEQERTLVGRELKRGKGAFESMPTPTKPDETMSVEEAQKEADEVQTSIESLMRAASNIEMEKNNTRRMLSEALDKVTRLKAELDGAEADVELLTARVEDNLETARGACRLVLDAAGYEVEEIDFSEPEVVLSKAAKELGDELTTAKAKVAEVAGTAQKVADYNRWVGLADEVKKNDALYGSLSDQIKGVDENLTSLLSAHELPVEGLVLREDGIYRGDVSLSQCSSSELLGISLSLEMAALDLDEGPRLRVMVLEDGDKFDPVTLQKLWEVAEGRGVQLIVEQAVQGRELALLLDKGTDEEVAAYLADEGIPTAIIRDGRGIQE